MALGCATIAAPGPDHVPVRSEPRGALVYLDGKYVGTTPLVLTLEPKSERAEIKIHMDGYAPIRLRRDKEVNGWVWGNILAGGLIGLIVDASTGRIEKFDESPILVMLHALPGGSPGAAATYARSEPRPAASRLALAQQEAQRKANDEALRRAAHAQEERREQLRKAERERFVEEHAAWKARTESLDEKRKPQLLAGVITGAAGAAVFATGLVLELDAVDEHRKAQATADAWRNSASESQRSMLAQQVAAIEHRRDVFNTAGVTLLSVGGAALATSIVLFALTPGLPEEPKPSRMALKGDDGRGLTLLPLFGRGSAGLVLDGRM